MRRTNVFKFGENFSELFDEVLGYDFEPFVSATEKVVSRAAGYRTEENEDSSKLYFELDCPGYTSSNFEINVSNTSKNILEVNAKTEGEKPRSFSKTFQFGSKWQLHEPIECKCENGILYMTFGLKEEVKPKRIQVH